MESGLPIPTESEINAWNSAVVVERERCAQIADRDADYWSGLEFRSGHAGDMETSLNARKMKHAAQQIAEKIRGGK